MSMFAVAGLPTMISLPVPLIVKLIPESQKNQRPGITRQTPGYWVQHETANYNVGADAEMHYRYLANGAQGQLLSFHFAVDDREIYQMIPVDEVTWQAADGAGPGNMSGISCELCVNQDSDWDKARTNAEALAGAVMKALGMGVERVKRHYDFNAADPNRHYCPKEMMTSGYWPTFVSNVGTIIGGSANVPPASIYPAGMDEGIAKMLFGTVTGDDGRTYGFDPRGVISNRWLNRGKGAGIWPQLQRVRTFDQRTYYVFTDGWTLWRIGNGSIRELK